MDPPHSAALFPVQVPMQYAYLSDRYFVRECYALYYERIERMFRTNKYNCATVTGTPGIGTSVFMAYFLRRYSRENSDAKIIVASYDSTSLLEQVAVWEAGQLIVKAEDDMDEMSSVLRAHRGDNVLYLLDGPPTRRFVQGRWVCFTSPNKVWIDKNRKNQQHRLLFMPPWTLEELQEAAQVLHMDRLLGAILDEMAEDDDGGSTVAEDTAHARALEADNEVAEDEVSESTEQYRTLVAEQLGAVNAIEARFRIFGGVARVCLVENDEFVGLEYARLRHAVDTMDVGKLKQLLVNECGSEDCHRIFHYHPDPVPITFKGRVASKHVGRLLTDRLSHNFNLHDRELVTSVSEGSAG